jgi:hypothetical protein
VTVDPVDRRRQTTSAEVNLNAVSRRQKGRLGDLGLRNLTPLRSTTGRKAAKAKHCGKQDVEVSFHAAGCNAKSAPPADDARLETEMLSRGWLHPVWA